MCRVIAGVFIFIALVLVGIGSQACAQTYPDFSTGSNLGNSMNTNRLDVTAINQKDPANVWHENGLTLLAGCVPASFAMLIDYMARADGTITSIDFPLVMQQIRDRYGAGYDSSWLLLKRYLDTKMQTNMNVGGELLASLNSNNPTFYIGNNKYVQIDWNPYFNDANSYEGTLGKIKQSINAGKPVAIGTKQAAIKDVNQKQNPWLLAKKDSLSLGGHMMVITGYDQDPSCTDNPDNICSFTANDTWSEVSHLLSPHRITVTAQSQVYTALALQHDTLPYVFILLYGNACAQYTPLIAIDGGSYFSLATQHYYPNDFYVSVSSQDSGVSLLSINGPNIVSSWPNSGEIVAYLSTKPVTGDRYVVEINNNGSFEQSEFFVNGVNDNFAWLSVPANNSTITTTTPTFSWQAPSNASRYFLIVSELSGSSESFIWSVSVPGTANPTTITYNYNGSATSALVSERTYKVYLHSYDANGNQATTQSVFAVQ